ncbi:UPF0149 family protein [Alteromonas oceanisediminis]|uniref:UPF0149 family protein n=1 Tax=Alteromonas oceanisediminis TaxID=2836180 RepID=UPI001BDA9F56|nr:UPF0149 family protein [Alteromonas oceanisediminis]MBT0585265.1 UPF0149 family protein [Alteromonas oceanisediminis]
MKPLDGLYSKTHYRAALQPKPFVEGVIAAVSCAPEIPMPPEWMPWVFNVNVTDDSRVDWEVLTDALVKALRDTLSLVRANEPLLPKQYCLELTLSDSEQAQWLTGFLYAHQQLQPVWQRAWEHLQTASIEEAETASHSLTHCLKVFSALADPQALLAKSDADTLRKNLPEVAKTLPRTLQQYRQLADRLAGYLPNQFESFTQRTD